MDKATTKPSAATSSSPIVGSYIDNKKRKATTLMESDDVGGGSFADQDDANIDMNSSYKLKEEEEEEDPSNQASASTSAFITQEGEMPQKKFYRQRAHCNPLSHNDTFEYPLRPDLMDWKQHYPNLDNTRFHSNHNNNNNNSSSSSNNNNNNRNSALPLPLQPTVLDIGCGFGGLTVALSTLLPNEIIFGLEIRAKVTEYVRLRLLALRGEHITPHPPHHHHHQQQQQHPYQNASVMRTNSMKFLPHYFAKNSIYKIFFCFPDPHFKRKNHIRRIVSDRLLSEYTYLLQEGTGKLYTITDVEELHMWHVEKCNAHPLLERTTIEEDNNDPCVTAMRTQTEEGQKVDRNGGQKYYAVYRRIVTPPTTDSYHPWHAKNFFHTTTTTTTTIKTNSATSESGDDDYGGGGVEEDDDDEDEELQDPKPDPKQKEEDSRGGGGEKIL